MRRPPRSTRAAIARPAGPRAAAAAATAAEEAGAREPFEDAALYDFEYRRRRGDVTFYRTLAAERGGPILELACGTGRLMVPLLRDGHVVLGLDRSSAMLTRAAARVARLAPSRRARALLVRADMRRFALGAGRFAFVVSAFHSIQHLTTEADLLLCLRAARRCLRPGGWLAFDCLAPDPAWIARDPNRRWARTAFRHPETGQRFVYTTNHSYDAARKVLHFRLYYAPVDGETRPAGPERVVRLAHRQWAPDEIRAAAGAAGFRVLMTYGGWDGRPLGADADEHIYVLGASPTENGRDSA